MPEFSPEELEAAEAGPEDIVEQQPAAQPRDDQGRFSRDDAGDEGADSKVPYGVLKSERQEHRQTKAALAAKDEELAQVREQLNQIAEMRKRILGEQPQRPEPTDREQDPTGVDYLRQRLDQVEAGQHQREQREQAATVQQEEQRLLLAQLHRSEAEFAQQNPDYNQAADHLARSRIAELQAYGVPQHQIGEALQQEIYEITANAIQMGKTPAQLVYEVAQMRGFRPGGQQAANPMFAAIERGQKSKSLSSARGSAPTDPNANAIANMSEAEFESAMRDPQFAQLVASIG
jgi:hypothetical protein